MNALHVPLPSNQLFLMEQNSDIADPTIDKICISFKTLVGLEFIFSINARCGDKVVIYIYIWIFHRWKVQDFSLHNKDHQCYLGSQLLHHIVS